MEKKKIELHAISAADKRLKEVSRIVESRSGSNIAKRDYSADCNLNDEDKNNNCWNCTRFMFPVGCMVHLDGKGRCKQNE